MIIINDVLYMSVACVLHVLVYVVLLGIIIGFFMRLIKNRVMDKKNIDHGLYRLYQFSNSLWHK